MKVSINKGDGREISFRFPIGWALGSLGALYMRRVVGLKRIRGKDLRRLRRELKKCKKQYPNWHIIQIESRKGSRINMKI